MNNTQNNVMNAKTRLETSISGTLFPFFFGFFWFAASHNVYFADHRYRAKGCMYKSG